MRRVRFFAYSASFLAVGLALGLVGCQQLFTTSLGSSLARTKLTIPTTLTPAQAADLAAQAKDNPALATALVSSLVVQIAATTDPATKTALQGSAASAAIVASGTSAALTGLITDFASGTPTDPTTLTSLLATIKAGGTPDVITALSYLNPATGIADPAASGLGATEYAIAAIVIAASVIPPGATLGTFDPGTLSPADHGTFLLAQNILAQAVTLIEPGSASAGLLNSLSGMFKL